MITVKHDQDIQMPPGYHDMEYGQPFLMNDELCVKLDTDQYVNLESGGYTAEYDGEAVLAVDIDIVVRKK
jgi:hypothetical protein